jgi:hypothetical protein
MPPSRYRTHQYDQEPYKIKYPKGRHVKIQHVYKHYRINKKQIIHNYNRIHYIWRCDLILEIVYNSISQRTMS